MASTRTTKRPKKNTTGKPADSATKRPKKSSAGYPPGKVVRPPPGRITPKALDIVDEPQRGERHRTRVMLTFVVEHPPTTSPFPGVTFGPGIQVGFEHALIEDGLRGVLDAGADVRLCPGPQIRVTKVRRAKKGGRLS
jgi:hypothetical protein